MVRAIEIVKFVALSSAGRGATSVARYAKKAKFTKTFFTASTHVRKKLITV